MYTYAESCTIMFTPYVIVTALWIPMTYIVEQYTDNILIVTLIVDLLATTIVYIQSLIHKNTSVYDPYWHIPPFYMLFYWFYRVNTLHNNLLIIVPLVYFIRHNYNYFTFWPGMSYEDFRYPEFKQKIQNPKLYWVFSYFGLHCVPTLLVYFGLFPTYFAMFDSVGHYNAMLFYFGVIFALGAIAFESVADLQLFPWRSRKTSDYIDEGLWRYSRHPNYFGECMYWWGIFIMTLAFGTQYLFTAIGAIIMQCLFVFFSIPAMEKHLLKKRPKYAQQIQRVSSFIPWFRK